MNRKEIQELLNSLSTQLKADIEAAQTELKNAESITAKINEHFTKSAELVAKFEDPDNGFNAKLDKAAVDTAKITEAASTAETTLATIQTNIATAQQNVATMQTAYAEFEAAKARIDEPTSGLDAILTTSTQLLSQITANATEVNTATETIRQSLATAQQNVATMQTAYAEFEAIKIKIDDPTSGLDVLLTSSQKVKADIDAVQQESETLYKEISRYKDTAAKNIASIEATKADSDKALEAITANQTESESLKTKIGAIFSLASQRGHANYFDERRRKLVLASWGWLALSIVFVSVAVVLAVCIIVPLTKTDHGTTATVQELIVRFSVITPFLLLGIFGATNYSKERRLAEHYGFRAVSALSIEGSILLLNRSLEQLDSEGKDPAIINFAVTTMSVIYSEPQEQVKNTRFHLRGGNKLIEVGTELNQTLGNINNNLADVVSKENKTSS